MLLKRHSLSITSAVIGTLFWLLAIAWSAPQASVGKDGELLQFTAGSHVVGFGTGRIYIASGNHMVKIELVGARAVAPVAAGGAAPTAANVSGMAPTLGQVTYAQAWDGVTVVYENMHGGVLKSTYRIQPAADGMPVEQILLAYNRPLRLDARGNLVISHATGELIEQAPVAWQEIRGEKKPVSVGYVLHGEREVGFKVADYDPDFALVIDPAMSWNTFLGGAGAENGYGIAVDANGNVYVAGFSETTWGSPMRPYTASIDAFAAKFSSDGALTWNTFLGGAGVDYGQAIAVDASGNVYVAGRSDATWGSPVRPHTALFDAFAAKLTADGALVWNTFLGGTGNDNDVAIGVDASGNVYLAHGTF